MILTCFSAIYRDKFNTLVAPQEPDVRNQQLNTLLQDVERPKGLYIYHGMFILVDRKVTCIQLLLKVMLTQKLWTCHELLSHQMLNK